MSLIICVLFDVYLDVLVAGACADRRLAAGCHAYRMNRETGGGGTGVYSSSACCRRSLVVVTESPP